MKQGTARSVVGVTGALIGEMRRRYPDTVVLFRSEDLIEAWHADATLIESFTTTHSGNEEFVIMTDVELPAIADRLQKQGYQGALFDAPGTRPAL